MAGTVAPALQPIRIRARQQEGFVEVTLLMPHPMETGLRHDAQGTLVPAHHITDLVVSLAGRTVFAARMGIAVSADPLLGFRVAGEHRGAALRVAWTDNRGDRRSDDGEIR